MQRAPVILACPARCSDLEMAEMFKHCDDRNNEASISTLAYDTTPDHPTTGR
jgi:hypothetical protein